MNVEEKIISDVKMYGWTIINVLPDQNNQTFSYTIGLMKSFNHPEIVISGIKAEVADILLNNIGNSIKEGKAYINDVEYDDILNNYNCVFKSIDSQELKKYFGKAEWFYSNDTYKILQLVLPDKNKNYPWDEHYEFSNQIVFYGE